MATTGQSESSKTLGKEQVGDLLDVFGVAYAVMAQCVAKAPEFLYDVDHGVKSPFLSSLEPGPGCTRFYSLSIASQ